MTKYHTIDLAIVMLERKVKVGPQILEVRRITWLAKPNEYNKLEYESMKKTVIKLNEELQILKTMKLIGIKVVKDEDIYGLRGYMY